MKFSILKECRICKSEALEEVFKVGDQVALSGYFPEPDETDTCGPLTVMRCKGCGLSQLRETYPPMDMYGSNYGYQSSLNQSMVNHLRRVSQTVYTTVGISVSDPVNVRVMDIGSNDGTFLRFLPHSWQTVGVDPTLNNWPGVYPERCLKIPEFFDLNTLYEYGALQKYDAITTLAMFYDLPNPVSFARQINECLKPDGIWILEVGYLPHLFATKGFDAICHEHLEYYRLQDIVNIANMAGFRILNFSFTPTNGGSVLATLVKKGAGSTWSQHKLERSNDMEDILGLEIDSANPTHWRLLPGYLRRVKAEIFDFLDTAECPMGYGASTKGNILLQYFGITKRELPCIAEINEDKFGKVTPGSRIPIVRDGIARSQHPSHWFVLPWHFKENIEQREDIPCFFPLPRDLLKGTVIGDWYYEAPAR